jgi:hypothetical protein
VSETSAEQDRQASRDFFDRLFDTSRELISAFPLTQGPAEMDYIATELESAVVAKRSTNPFQNPNVKIGSADPQSEKTAVGLNTVGMLLDRMSILAIKVWNLDHRAGKPNQAEHLRNTQVAELVEALAAARPGHSSINNKLTSHKTSIDNTDFASASYNLVTTNLLLWEAQEILYNHDIAVLPAEELRKYIQFFSKHNLSRNVSIEASDRLYWAAVQQPE